ncbi:glycoside hydrolase family 38 C-terminal domain-containing protein [Sphingobacterium sp. JB170]|uniref:glycoside hydrolase family 38 N-terminal domain-containing protein n=1 Tax=Sphingobacterium sp. JB170 TaxID=1434842 RepID=UPI00097F3F55|nr:glycoside hydrolase family 38 C-terminal domain-containing protein [Sphingobacterium sp. JB170]SJN47071.1 Alpha-mannosidase [Sphingobacterium sp. JB170]
MRRKTNILSLLLALSACTGLYAQKPYFVDGYHGGVYGHYPSWVTGFMIEKLAAHPEWKIGMEIEPETWDSVKIDQPQAYAAFAELAADRRIDFTNPTYAQPYCYNISGESIIRQFAYGMQKINTHFPAVTFTSYAVEEPCFTSSLPQLLKQFGFKYAVLKCPNTCWGGYTAAYGGELVNWVGPEGTSILTVPRYASEALQENSTWQTTAWNNSNTFLQAAYAQGIANPVGMCYQDAGWDNGPWLGHGEQVKNESTYLTWTEYFKDISTGKSTDDWRLSQEDIRVNLMWGSQALQRIAQDVRKSENNIMVAEKIGAMAYIDNDFRPAPEDENEAWRTLMMAQHHDSWIVPYNQLAKGRTWEQAVRAWTNTSDSLSTRMIASALDSYPISTEVSRQGTNDTIGYVKVFNTVAASRSQVMRVALPPALSIYDITIYDQGGKHSVSEVSVQDGRSWLLFRPEFTGLGYQSYVLVNKEPHRSQNKAIQQVHVDAKGNCIIENAMYKITLDGTKGGVISSLKAKYAANKEFVEQNGEYAFGELAGHFVQQDSFLSSKNKPAKITVLEDNPFLVQVKVQGHIGEHPFSQTITLEAGQRRIDFDLQVDWLHNVGIGEYKQQHDWTDNRRAYTDDRYKLKVLFPNSLVKPSLYKDAPFDVTKSEQENTFFGSWDAIKHNVILHWVDLMQQDEAYGLALFSDHTTSYLHGRDYPLGLTAQYSGVGLWGVDYKITGPLKMRYALLPHVGSWQRAKIAAESNFWNEPLLGVIAADAGQNKNFVRLGDSGLEVSAMKEQGDELLLRLYNAAGEDKPQQVDLGFTVSQIHQVLLNGKLVAPMAFQSSGGKTTFNVEIPQFGIQTYRIKKK